MTSPATRFRVLRLYRRRHQRSSLHFLGELYRAFPFPIRKLQCDDGHEFPFAFVAIQGHTPAQKLAGLLPTFAA